MQFQNGNKGRKPNSKNKTTPMMREILEETITEDKFKQVLNKLFFIAMNDNSKSQVKALEMILNYTLGRPKTMTELSFKPEPVGSDFNFNEMLKWVKTPEPPSEN